MTDCPSRLATRYKQGRWPAHWACDVCDHVALTGMEANDWLYEPELDAYVIPRHQKHSRL